MRILVLETDRRAADDAAVSLTAAGHDVVRCHERGRPAFPCRGLCEDGGGCPLDEWVDVALTVRAHPYPRPTPSEDGVSCAIRRHVPLVVAGTSALNPYPPWTVDVADGRNVVEVCEGVAVAALPIHGGRATDEAKRLVEAHGLAPDAVYAAARRGHRCLAVEVTVPREVDRGLRDVVAARVAGVVRDVDPHISVIDVSVLPSA